MPVTLAQASVGVANAVDRRIIDEFRKSSFLLDRLTFDQAVAPAGRGASLAYSYYRTKTQRNAAFRAINAEYTPEEVEKEEFTVHLKPMGGSFQIDRVLSRIGIVDEVDFQMAALVGATRAYFNDQFINGDSAVTTDGFDGLDKALVGSSTEVDSTVDWTGVNSQILALQAVQEVNAWLGKLNGRADAILGNATSLAWFTMIAALSGQRGSVDWFGQPIEAFRTIPLIDMGEKAGSSDQVIPVDEGDGTTDLYAVRFGLDGVHAVAVTGPLIRTWLPDFSTAGAVKTGEAELGPAAPVLKATKAAAVLRGVKVAAPAGP